MYAMAAILVIVAAGIVTVTTQRVAAADVDTTANSTCSAENSSPVTTLFGVGSGWTLCWRIQMGIGLRITDVTYRTVTGTDIPVLKSASIAQIDVPYDGAQRGQLDLPAFGSETAILTASDCPGGQLEPSTDPVLCTAVTKEGLGYEWSDYDFGTGNHAAESECLALYTVTPVDWYTYVNKWQFCDDGSIRGLVGDGGTLSPTYFGSETNSVPVGPGSSRLALAHFHNVFWRLQFDLGGSVQSTVSELDDQAAGASHTMVSTTIQREAASMSAPDRSWTVKSNSTLNADGHRVAYNIILKNEDPYRNAPGHAYTNNDFYVTQYKDCELLAAGSLEIGCEHSVDKYVNGETITEPVIWLQNGFHHHPRDEDEPVMHEHWQSFTLMPDGLTSQNETVKLP